MQYNNINKMNGNFNVILIDVDAIVEESKAEETDSRLSFASLPVSIEWKLNQLRKEWIEFCGGKKKKKK